jgi:hypothetical protein
MVDSRYEIWTKGKLKDFVFFCMIWLQALFCDERSECVSTKYKCGEGGWIL